jgi:hypothetical protein
VLRREINARASLSCARCTCESARASLFLILRTAKVIAGHFNLGWRTVALAPRSLFSDRATLKSAPLSLSNDRAALSRVCGLSHEFRRSPRNRRVVMSSHADHATSRCG